MRVARLVALLALSIPLGLACPTFASEYEIGDPRILNGMEIAAVYLQPVEMEPAGMMRAAAESECNRARRAGGNTHPGGG